MAKKVEAARDTQRATPPEGKARRWAAAKAVLDKEVGMVDKMQDNIKELEMMAEHATQDAQEAREVAHVESMPPDMRENVEAFHNLLTDKAEQTAAFYRETARRLKQVMQGVNESVRLTVETFKPLMQSISDHAEELREVSEMWRLLGPYIDAETKEHPEIYGDDEHPEVGEDVPLEVLIAAAAKRARAAGVDVPTLAAEQLTESANPIVIINSARIKDFDFPVDKVNKTIWRLLEKHSTGGQIALHMESHTSKEPVLLYYAISFADLESQGITITKKLNAYEKRVYIAAAALYSIKSARPFTYTELYYAMGYTGKPGRNDLEKLAAAVTKMGMARIMVDNSQEIAAKYNYPHFKYDGYLLPMERITASVDGKITEAAIHLFREPPLVTFARQREQITQINIRLLQSPISKTEANIALEDYLIERIAQARNERGKLQKKRCKTDEERQKKAEALKKAANARILFTTLYDHANIETVKQKQRAPEKIKRILEHYKTCNFISEFKIDTTGVTVAL